MPTSLQLKRRYDRSDPKGRFPVRTGLPDLELNRLAMFWRPLIDMTDSDLAPHRLRLIQPVWKWLANPEPGRRSWFARIGVPGLRHQVLRHAGLDRYDCTDPTALPRELRSPQWNTLVDTLARFAVLDDGLRALVVFHLAQLTYCQYAVKLTAVVTPTGEPARDRYAYEVARVHARCPGLAGRALPVFETIAESSADRLLSLAACAQGVGHAIRNGNDIVLANRFESLAGTITGLADGWHTSLVRSRYHRALALLRMTERNLAGMQRELDLSLRFGEELFPGLGEGPDMEVARENKRIIIESRIKAASRARTDESTALVRALCAELSELDPYCVEARLVIGDGYAAIADYREAASWYVQAGELGTTSGATGWFRAAQCYDHLGERGSAVNAMARLLELDSAAVEAERYITRVSA